jgi:hypothetical protein
MVNTTNKGAASFILIFKWLVRRSLEVGSRLFVSALHAVVE